MDQFAFLPRTLTVPAGTTVRFEMPTKSREAHTATFGPGDPIKEEGSYLGKLAASFVQPVFDPIAFYPSDVPGTVGTVNAAAHGNGFWNSGFLDQDPLYPTPSANSATFDTPGTYEYFCLIHPFMHGTVVVQ